MLKRLEDFFYQRLATSKRRHPIYIIPTVDGNKVMVLNLTLLIIGLVYANNYVLLFNFILFCLFLGSMVYTHFNIKGLSLISASLSPLYVNETANLNLTFSSSNSQGHYFIRASLKSPLMEIASETQTFAVSHRENVTINIRVRGKARGEGFIESLYLETLFPFNFFRCFTFARVDLHYYVYPEKVNLNIHQSKPLESAEGSDNDEHLLRDYRSGDPLKRIDWKKVAKNNEWYSRERQTASPQVKILGADEELLNQSREEVLKSICFALHGSHQENVMYGLRLGKGLFITPGNSPSHLIHCLEELAKYDH